MAVRDLQHYIALVDAGEQTVPDRLDMLREHRDTIRRQIRELTLSPPPPNTRSPRTAAMPENPDAQQLHPLLRWTIFGRNVPLGETSTTTYATDPCPGGQTCPSGRRPRAGYLPTLPGWLEIRSSRAQPATSPQTAPGPPRTQELPRRTAAHPPNGSSLALCNPTRTADRSWAEPAWCAAVASVWAARRLFARAARLITRASVRRPVPVLTTRAPDLLAGATDYMPSLHLRLAQASQVSEDITSHMVAAASNLTEGRRALSHIRPGRAAPAHRARGTSQTSQSHIPSRGSRRRSPATSPVGHHTRAQRSAEDRHRSTSARLCPGQRPDRSPLRGAHPSGPANDRRAAGRCGTSGSQR